MSAFVVGHDHIDGLLTWAIDAGAGYSAPSGNYTRITAEDATQIGRWLLEENERSVGYRYPNTDELPGTIGQSSGGYHFRRWPLPGLSALAVLKACDCFDYQACETSDYRHTLAAAIIDGIRHNAIHKLPGMSDAPGWELRRPRAPSGWQEIVA